MEFRILGPLDVRIAGESVSLGGAKQRAVLAALLLNANEVISVERLVDEVWGDRSPPSAAHSLEAYVSRIRQLLNGHGSTLVRRGAGYCLGLGEAALDATAFTDYLDEAAEAGADGDQARASKLAAAALSLWHGPALADVALASAGRAEAERLEELRLRAYELRFGAELELRRHEALVGELQSLVRQNPYRERFVAQLMLALYRSGRQAEALDAYEQTRRRLDADLGLQPSLELQQLSAQIVRQEAHLRSPARVTHQPPRARRSGRLATLVAGGVAAAAVMSLAASGGTTGIESPDGAVTLTSNRVALVLPRDPAGADVRDPAVYYSALAFRNSTTAWGHEAETIVVSDEGDPNDSNVQERVGVLTDGRFDLVIVVGDGAAARAVAPLVDRFTSTNYAFVDVSLADLGLAGSLNATGYTFADHESTRLAGYLSGLVAPRGASPRARADMVSVVVGERTPHSERIARGFARGARHALPGVQVRVDYASKGGTRTECEALANTQVSGGSDVVFALGRPCSQAALVVARTHGVWAMRADDDSVPLGPHILATTWKFWEGTVSRILNDLELETSRPRPGRDVVLGLADDYAVGVEASEVVVSPRIWAKVVRLCSSIRRQTIDDN